MNIIQKLENMHKRVAKISPSNYPGSYVVGFFLEAGENVANDDEWTVCYGDSADGSYKCISRKGNFRWFEYMPAGFSPYPDKK